MRPVLFVTGHASSYRIGGLARLHEAEGIELALFGGRHRHAAPALLADEEIPFPHRHVRPRELFALAGSGRYRAVVCPTGGRLAPLATWAGARRSATPLILWASLWAHPRSAAHLLSYLPLRRLYSSADAVVTYGDHVSAYVSARGATNVHTAPQAVDNEFWSRPEENARGTGGEPNADVGTRPNVGTPSNAETHTSAERADVPTRFLFVGRDAPEKGLELLLRAWSRSGLAPPIATLTLVGAGREDASVGDTDRDGVVGLGRRSPEQLRAIYAASDVLVVPSVRTRTFREPWGLVVNEAMNGKLAVIASDAVGAAAGGLVLDGENGLVFDAGDERALERALLALARDPDLRERLGAQGARDVRHFTHEAWARGFGEALATLGLSRGRW